MATHSDVYGAVDTRFTILGSSDGAGITNLGGNQLGLPAAPLDPGLGPLADNGGLTQTHALLPGSTAIDGGDLGLLSPPPADQRGVGFSRIADGDDATDVVSDIGAYEAQLAPSADFDSDSNIDNAPQWGCESQRCRSTVAIRKRASTTLRYLA